MESPSLPAAIRTRADLERMLALATNYEERLPADPAARAFNLERTERLLGALGDPHRGPRTVHVAGSKGKGSTCRMLDAILRAEGRGPVGLYTSPHLTDLAERIAVDGAPVDDAALCRAADAVLPWVRETHGTPLAPTFFEVLTGMAWVAFRERACADVVLEVGLGGRLDATNVCVPAATVITTIEREHVRLLGDTVERIAAEKAGVLKPGVPAVTTAEGAALAVVEARARAVGAPLSVVGRDVRVARAATGPGPRTTARIEVGGEAIEVDMPVAGVHHATNAAAAAAAARRLGIAPAAIARALRGLALPGTLEPLGDAPTVVVDGAHTPASAARTREAVEACWPDRSVVLVLGAMEDKDLSGMLRALAPLARRTFCTAVPSPRALPAEVLARRAAAGGAPAAEAVPDPRLALARARRAAGAAGLVLVTGSVHLAGLLRASLGAEAPRPGPAAGAGQRGASSPSRMRR